MKVLGVVKKRIGAICVLDDNVRISTVNASVGDTICQEGAKYYVQKSKEQTQDNASLAKEQLSDSSKAIKDLKEMTKTINAFEEKQKELEERIQTFEEKEMQRNNEIEALDKKLQEESKKIMILNEVVSSTKQTSDLKGAK